MAEISVNDAAVIASLKKFDKLADEAAGKALGFLGIRYEVEAFANANGPINRGGPHIPWAKPGPNKRTGQLSLHIKSSLPIRQGFGSYVVGVGSSMYYAAWVENGNDRWGAGVNYPYMRPAYISMKPKAAKIFSDSYKRFRGI